MRFQIHAIGIWDFRRTKEEQFQNHKGLIYMVVLLSNESVGSINNEKWLDEIVICLQMNYVLYPESKEMHHDRLGYMSKHISTIQRGKLQPFEYENFPSYRWTNARRRVYMTLILCINLLIEKKGFREQPSGLYY